MKTCTVCKKVGKYYDTVCGLCKEKERKRQMYKSTLPRFVTNYKSKV